MNELTSKSKHSMLTRIISAVVMAALGIPAVIFGGPYFFAFVMVATFFGIYEFIQAPNKNRFNIFIYLIVFIFTFSFVLWQFLKPMIFNDTPFLQMTGISFSTIGIMTYFVFLFATCLFSEKFTIGDASYLFTMGIYFALAISSILFLRLYPNNPQFNAEGDLRSSLLLIYVLLGTITNDVGAYFVGVLFGKHHMAPRVSPHKTWEGFAGGVGFSILVSILFAFTCSHLGAPLLKGILEWNGLGILWICLISIMMPLLANLGDLIFSSIKRNYQIKDFGNLIPGHGGILDRIDSLTFTSVSTVLLILSIVFLQGHGLI